jgi:cytochrome c biogenesis protein
MQGFFYPSAVELDSGALASNDPEPTNPTVTFNVYTGDLGLDSGKSANIFQLPIDTMTQIAGRHTGIDVVLTPGDVFTLPGGLGSVEFSGLRRFIGVEIRHDATQLGVGISVLFMVAGLLASLGTRRRRVWIRVAGTARKPELEWGGMSRGDDPRMDAALDKLKDAAAKRRRWIFVIRARAYVAAIAANKENSAPKLEPAAHDGLRNPPNHAACQSAPPRKQVAYGLA